MPQHPGTASLTDHPGRARLVGALVLGVAAGCPPVEPPALLTDGDPADSSSSGDDAPTSTDAPPPTTGDEPPDPTAGPPGDACVALRTQARDILAAACSGCHSGPNAQVFDYVEDLEALVANGKVEGGDPEGSLLYQKIEIGAMPPDGPPLAASSQGVLRDWIAECVPPSVSDPLEAPACVGKNPFVSLDQMLDAMLLGINNFEQIEPADQPFIRYFTLTHLWNAGYCDSQLDAHRHALSKLLNSLSDDQTITRPTPVDPQHTIYRIDLRDYAWDAGVWDLLVAVSPFAVEYTQAKAVQLQKFTGVKIPFLWGDWFVTDASEAPLYDQVLYERVLKVGAEVIDPPMTRQQLEQRLDIDVQANIDAALLDSQGDTGRAGFQFSGVSQQNRVVERHQVPNGLGRAYWLSYDFLSEVDLGNIFYHPLDFAEDGGEIIFNLANGLQAYLLVDGLGERIDEAPIAVVSNEEEGGAPIRNGRSCMGCHYQGMRAVADEVRPFVDQQVGVFDAETVEKVHRLYPPADEFALVVQQDGDLFMSSLNKTGAPVLVAGQEVVSAVFHAFEDPYIDEARAAAEFGLTLAALTPKIGLLPQGLQMLSGGLVSRETMRDLYGPAICALKIGITKACTPL